jgi:hypothetical protein
MLLLKELLTNLKNKTMPIRIPIRFIKLLYFISRDRTKRGKVAVCRGGRMVEEDFLKYSAIANQLTNKN